LALQEEMSKLKSHSDKLQVKLDTYEKDVKLGEQLLLLKTNTVQDLQDQVNISTCILPIIIIIIIIICHFIHFIYAKNIP
jgi:hypothetical protein